MEKTTEQVKVNFTLPDKKVMVVPVRRNGGWLPNNHEASFLFKHSYVRLVLPRTQTGAYVDPLTQEEREYFESDNAGLALKKGDLLIHKKENNFWKKYKVKLDKNVLQLNLSDPEDYIKYKVLLANKDLIAPSSSEKFAKGTYRFAIEEEGYQNDEKVKAAFNKKDAYKFFGKIDNSPTKMRDFINVYNIRNKGNKTVPPNATSEFLIAEIEKIIEKDIVGFVALSKDATYEKQVLIFNALRAGALKRDGMTYKTPEDITLGDSMNSVINYFDAPENSEELIKLKARIENAKV